MRNIVRVYSCGVFLFIFLSSCQTSSVSPAPLIYINIFQRFSVHLNHEFLSSFGTWKASREFSGLPPALGAIPVKILTLANLSGSSYLWPSESAMDQAVIARVAALMIVLIDIAQRLVPYWRGRKMIVVTI